MSKFNLSQNKTRLRYVVKFLQMVAVLLMGLTATIITYAQNVMP
jgi:hypothetical protein